MIQSSVKYCLLKSFPHLGTGHMQRCILIVIRCIDIRSTVSHQKFYQGIRDIWQNFKYTFVSYRNSNDYQNCFRLRINRKALLIMKVGFILSVAHKLQAFIKDI